MRTLDVEIIYEENGTAKCETWEVEVTESISKALIETSGKSLSGMAPHGEQYRSRLILEKYVDNMLKLLGLNFKKVKGIKESE
jgi:hypothetical protein